MQHMVVIGAVILTVCQFLKFCTLSFKMPIHAPKIGVFGGFCPQNKQQYQRDPQKAHPWAETRRMTYKSSKSLHVCGLGASRRIKQKIKKNKKGIPKKPQHVFFQVFAQTTHVVAAPHGFACVVIPATRFYNRTACTTVQAMTSCSKSD